MLVVSYSDFAANMNKYLPAASVSGLKILPQKKEKKNSRHLKFMQAVEAASGVLPSDIDIEKEKTEAILKLKIS